MFSEDENLNNEIDAAAAVGHLKDAHEFWENYGDILKDMINQGRKDMHTKSQNLVNCASAILTNTLLNHLFFYARKDGKQVVEKVIDELKAYIKEKNDILL